MKVDGGGGGGGVGEWSELGSWWVMFVVTGLLW